MQRCRFFIASVVLLAAIFGAQTELLAAVKAKKKLRTATFKVRIENISSAGGQTAKDGTRWPFALSPGLYVIDEKPIALFDSKGEPVSGDVTSSFTLYDAGTEVDEEPGVGPTQAPRQKAPNTGADEHGVVHRPVKDAFYARTPQLFRVTITPVN